MSSATTDPAGRRERLVGTKGANLPRRLRVSSDFAFTLKVARPGLWATTIWFYLLPLGGHYFLGSWRFWLGIFYVTFPLGLLIYGCNDLVDADADRINPRKDSYVFGARGTPRQLAALPWLIIAVQALCAVMLCAVLGIKALLWLLVIAAATAAYNWPAPGLKGRPPYEVLNQAAYLLVFVLGSWLGQVAQLPWPTFVFGALFAMHAHLFGEIMDIVPDRAGGRRTTATVLGLVPTKCLVVVFLLVEAALIDHYFEATPVALFLACSAAWFALDAAFIWRDRQYTTRQMKLFVLGFTALALGSMPYVWYTACLTHLR